jgi:shikimate 5-dehydrogenase
VRAALDAGIPATNGLGMLIGQAALAFVRWSGCSTPIDEIQDIMWTSITNYFTEKT